MRLSPLYQETLFLHCRSAPNTQPQNKWLILHCKRDREFSINGSFYTVDCFNRDAEDAVVEDAVVAGAEGAVMAVDVETVDEADDAVLAGAEGVVMAVDVETVDEADDAVLAGAEGAVVAIDVETVDEADCAVLAGAEGVTMANAREGVNLRISNATALCVAEPAHHRRTEYSSSRLQRSHSKGGHGPLAWTLLQTPHRSRLEVHSCCLQPPASKQCTAVLLVSQHSEPPPQ